MKFIYFILLDMQGNERKLIGLHPFDVQLSGEQGTSLTKVW